MEISPRLKYFIQRGFWYGVTLIVAVTLNFVLPRLGPVNTVDIITANINTSGMSAEDIDDMERAYAEEFNLDKPIWLQYFAYLGQTLRGDLGTSSIDYPRKCLDIISGAIPWSLMLVLPAILTAWLAGNILGALAAYKRGVFDKILYPFSLFLSSSPFFCFGLILVFIFYTQLGIVDSLGAYSQSVQPEFSLMFVLDVLNHYWLPFLSIFLIMLGGQAVGMRSMSIYELDTDYVNYAKMLGVKERKILYYVFRNAMLPQLTGLALNIGIMIGGTMITEIIFSYPGLGLMMLNRISSNDYPMIQAIALLIALIVLFLNFGVDIFVGFLDPRIRAGQTTGGAKS